MMRLTRTHTTIALTVMMTVFGAVIGGAMESVNTSREQRQRIAAEKKLDDALRFMGLVVDDVEGVVDRAGALTAGAAEIVETRNALVGQEGSLYVMNENGTYDRARLNGRGPFLAMNEKSNRWVSVDLTERKTVTVPSSGYDALLTTSGEVLAVYDGANWMKWDPDTQGWAVLATDGEFQ